MGRLLVVDDEQSMREFLSICLRRAGHDVEVEASADLALARLAATVAPSPASSSNGQSAPPSVPPFDILITDLHMPGSLDGLGLLRAVKARGFACEVILVTAFATADTALAAMKDGAYDYLTKPFKVDEITAVIARAMEKRSLVAENAALRDQVKGRVRLAQMLGKSRAMQKVFELIGKVQSTKTSVLVTGESGTGKELVARALHTESGRRDAPFVAVNCGAIPEELMESELFGHKKGAFTGAIADKRGLFAEASGGTLFLDEIGELSTQLQVKLLRALQERRIKPVGATEEFEIDVRVVAATNRELEEEVARGAFRADLYYRLNVIEIRLPPLRQRREDVALLAEHFVRRFAQDQGKNITGVAPAVLARLDEYDFPGNIRELENLMERAVALSDAGRIELDVLPSLRARAPASSPNIAVEGPLLPDEGVDLDRVISDIERNYVLAALERAGGVRKKAAGILGISFRSLRYRLQKLGMAKDEDDDGGAAIRPVDEA